MNDFTGEIKEKIIKEIMNSGFPLENFATVTLNKEGWSVRPSLDYFDKKFGDYRETDITAFNESGIPNITNMLVIECKKSESKPWVFIQQERLGYLSTNLNIAISPRSRIYYEYLEETMKFHHYSQKPMCTHYIIPFTNEEKNPKLAKSIFHAKNQVISATNHLLEQQSVRYNLYSELNLKTFFYPIILFDGLLYSATIEKNDVNLTEENHILLSIERELPKKSTIYLKANSFVDFEYKPYIIDIVKKDYFNDYLRNLKKYSDSCADEIMTSFVMA
jgi:hypothetical protein